MSGQSLTEEQMVLEMVREYIEEHQFFNFNKIISYISSRFAKASTNISIQGIVTILKSLVKQNHIIDGSCLTRDSVLLNENRKVIYNYISRNPGKYYYKIVKKTKFHNSVVEWHLDVLLKFNFIKKINIEDQEVYFKAEIDQEFDKTVYFIKRERIEKIIRYFLFDNNGITKTRISKELNMHYMTIDKYFQKLERLSILKKKKLSNKTIFFLNMDLWHEKYAIFYNNKEQ